MAVGGEIKVLLTLDKDGFQADTIKAGKVIQSMRRDMEQTAKSTKALEDRYSSLGQKFRDITLSISVLRFMLHDVHDAFLAFPRAVIKSASEIERTQRLLEGLSTSLDENRRKAEGLAGTKFIFDVSMRAPFNVESITDTFVKFRTAGLNPTNYEFQALIDNVAKFGGTSEHLKRASIAIQQMSGKGVISMEELRQQLGEAMPNAMRAMADGMGWTMGELNKQISQGKVRASEGLRAMFSVLAIEGKGDAAAMMDSWNGMVAQLETKWELFKKKIADNEFFNEAKKGLQEVLDAFGSRDAGEFASKLGQGLAAATRALSTLVKGVREYWGVIKGLVAFMAAKKGADFLMGMFKNAGAGGFSEVARKAVAEQQKSIDALNTANKLAALEKKALVDKQIADNERAIKAEISGAKKATQEKAAELEKQAAARRASIAAMKAELERAQQNEKYQRQAAASANAQSRSMMTNAYLGNAGNQNYQKLRDRASEMRAEAEASKQSVIALRQKIAAEEAAANAVQRRAQAVKGAFAVDTSVAAQLRAQNVVLREHSAAHAAAAARITTLGMASRVAAAGVGVLKAAFAGFLPAAVLSMMAWAGTKLYEIATRAERVRDAMTRKSFTDEEMKNAGARKETLEGRITGNKRRLEKDSFWGDSQADLKKQREAAKAQIIADQAELDEVSKYLRDGNTARSHEEAQDIASGAMRVMDAEVRALNLKAKTRLENARKERDDALKAFEVANPKATEDQKKAAIESKAKAILEANRKSSQEEVDFWKKKSDEVEAAINKATGKELTALQEQKDQISERLERVKSQLEAANHAGEFNPAVSKDGSSKKVGDDPLLRAIDDANASADIARQKLEDLKNGSKSIVSLRQQVFTDILASMAEGKFDQTNGVTRSGKARSKELEGWIAQLQDGKANVDDFIKSMNGLSAADKEYVAKLIEKMTAEEESKNRATALRSAHDMVTAATAELEAAQADYASGVDATSAQVERLERQFEKLRARLADTKNSFAELSAEQQKALDKTLAADILKRANASRSKDEYDSTKFIVNKRERAGAILAIDRDLARKQYEVDQENIAKMTEGSDEYWVARYAATETYTNKMIAANARYAEATRTALDELRDRWQDVATNMEQATANWSQDFVDRLTNALTGGEFKFKEFAANIGKEILKIGIQKELGGAITKGMEGIGKYATDILNIGDKKTADQKDPQQQAMNQIIEAGKSVVSSIGEGFGGLMDKVTPIFDTLSSAVMGVITPIWEWVSAIWANIFATQADTTAETASATTAWFADGGIMTSSGSLPLNYYANGGVANKPQLAVFGEGRMPEAYVPLPDGRSIPVSFKGAAQQGGSGTGGTNVQITVVMQSDGKTEEKTSVADQKTQAREFGERIKSVVVSEIANQKRPGGMLYSG